jgi:hypothetical protein
MHIFHAIPHSELSVGGPYTISVLISGGIVGYHPTTTLIELHQFIRPHKSSVRSVHNQMLIQGSTINSPQLTQVRVTTLEPRISTYHSSSFPFNYVPNWLCFPLVALPGLKFKSSFHSVPNFNHFNSIRGKKGPTCKWNQPLIFYH